MQKDLRGWWGALTVMVVAAALVILDITDGAFHRYWNRHSFTSSVLSGLLVLLLTVLIVDRVIRMRQIKNQSRAIAAQAAVIAAQGTRAADAVKRASQPDGDQQGASDALHTYTQLLLVSAPLLIDATIPRKFLETAQRLDAQLFAAQGDAGDTRTEKARKSLDASVEQLQKAAAPLLAVLNRAERAAVSSDDSGSDTG